MFKQVENPLDKIGPMTPYGEAFQVGYDSGAKAQMQADAKALMQYEVTTLGQPCILIDGEEYEEVKRLAEKERMEPYCEVGKPNTRKSRRCCWECSHFFVVEKGETPNRLCPKCRNQAKE